MDPLRCAEVRRGRWAAPCRTERIATPAAYGAARAPVSMKIVIVGGGIGGMALAAALQKLGKASLVLERAPQLGEVARA
jgi:NADPH-dependent 2,4-dienoyl-CoA reductase/sulfur reductase-like enzyme